MTVNDLPCYCTRHNRHQGTCKNLHNAEYGMLCKECVDNCEGVHS